MLEYELRPCTLCSSFKLIALVVHARTIMCIHLSTALKHCVKTTKHTHCKRFSQWCRQTCQFSHIITKYNRHIVTEALNALSAFIILRISTFSNVKWCNTKKSSITRYMFLLASSTELSSRSTSNGTSNWYLSTFTIQKTKQQASEHYSPTKQYTTLICY